MVQCHSCSIESIPLPLLLICALARTRREDELMDVRAPIEAIMSGIYGISGLFEREPRPPLREVRERASRIERDRGISAQLAQLSLSLPSAGETAVAAGAPPLAPPPRHPCPA